MHLPVHMQRPPQRGPLPSRACRPALAGNGLSADLAPQRALGSSPLQSRFGRGTSCRARRQGDSRRVGSVQGWRSSKQVLCCGAALRRSHWRLAPARWGAPPSPGAHLLQSCATPSCSVYGQRRAAVPREADSPSGDSRMVESYQKPAAFTACMQPKAADRGQRSQKPEASGGRRQRLHPSKVQAACSEEQVSCRSPFQEPGPVPAASHTCLTVGEACR